MNITILGATGWIGSHIMAQAKANGHNVTAVVRDADKVTDGTAVEEFDLQSQNDIAEVLTNADVVIASIGGRAAGNHELVAQTAKRLLTALSGSSTRLLWVGGAGSLEVAPGVTLVSSPDFPAEYKDEALAQGEALSVFKATNTTTQWTFVSPAAVIYPGASEGPYRIGGDAFFTNEQGESKISVTDYAIAMLDEVQNAAHINQRMSVAY
ncbi:NAD(P)-dependent oxidoreductase [Pseudoalteromonas sp. SR44-5]|uniref:NAD(P)-dependent oxidoreductase n=1 Tax=Pseudoalteromonas TaxID=53246 RepID=UPI00123129FC|nr:MULTISPECIES: NAD(P)-dependent oxidoreductase [Pseudoalteromonas]MBB1335053.1 NAD(P)-dependent oxidoreductase [Pseudoalteromonas sp. SR41-6]MBB1343270.1 NAD(P)-dependent oxidoreductase [Pseudoalteromonas sp. SR45-6]MBB1368090.1 NAD(P)-dependent oxidoreductase [Pseudoalteromonas sp. SR44-5]MBB1460475.1 NAD(P)-dependent oxidoreductase [Pseudoalteromonas sp. SG41-8]|tara:strand:- start:266 stop:895 length:630 start_codon:yes stop_codon:yes gene_type:complete